MSNTRPLWIAFFVAAAVTAIAFAISPRNSPTAAAAMASRPIAEPAVSAQTQPDADIKTKKPDGCEDCK